MLGRGRRGRRFVGGNRRGRGEQGTLLLAEGGLSGAVLVVVAKVEGEPPERSGNKVCPLILDYYRVGFPTV